MPRKKQVPEPGSPVKLTFDLGCVQFEATVSQTSEVVPLLEFADHVRLELQKRQTAIADAAWEKMHGRARR